VEQIIKKHGFKIVLALVLVIIAVMLLVTQLGTSASFPLNDEAPDFEFTKMDGNTVSLDNTDGKVRLVYFYFSNCPDVCLPTTYFLSQVQKELKEKGKFGEDALIMSITFDPERDTTERLEEFSGYYDADDHGWYFLRSDDPNYVKQVATAYSIYVNQEVDGNFTHSNMFTLIDGKGNIRKRYSITEELTAEEIVKDMEALM